VGSEEFGAGGLESFVVEEELEGLAMGGAGLACEGRPVTLGHCGQTAPGLAGGGLDTANDARNILISRDESMCEHGKQRLIWH